MTTPKDSEVMLPELPPLPTAHKYKVGFGPGDIADMLSTEEAQAYAKEYGALCYEAALSLAHSKQAKIDALMLEYCPNEMSAEQMAEWGRHQIRSQEEAPTENQPSLKSHQAFEILEGILIALKEYRRMADSDSKAGYAKMSRDNERIALGVSIALAIVRRVKL